MDGIEQHLPKHQLGARDERRSKDCWRVEAMFCRLNDYRHIANRYDKLAHNLLAAISLAAIMAF